MGSESETIFQSFGLSAADTVIVKFLRNLTVTLSQNEIARNMVHERAMFYERSQKAGESV